jgi:pimeloyl-ACP methyl ester carboxylesterase
MHVLGFDRPSVVAHSLGGSIATRYAGIEPGAFRQLVAIEGLGLSPRMIKERSAKPAGEKMRSWIARQRAQAGRLPRRYPSLEAAIERMSEQHPHLNREQARHLTTHGTLRNEDGTWSWKFDPYLNTWGPYDWPQTDVEQLWSAITCPLLCVYGKESQASDPETDGRARHFNTAEFVRLEGAGHWVHHDRLDEVEALCRRFLKR